MYEWQMMIIIHMQTILEKIQTSFICICNSQSASARLQAEYSIDSRNLSRGSFALRTEAWIERDAEARREFEYFACLQVFFQS